MLASVLFAAMFLLAGVVSSSAEVVFAWRVLLTASFYAALLAHPAPRRALVIVWRRWRARWWMPLLALLLTAIVGTQLWLFMWAPMNGHALDTALGFLLLPICLVLGGRFVLRQRVSAVQWVVVGLAAVAVGVKLAATPELSWVTLMVCISYAVYFVLRQRFGLDGYMVFGLEVALMSPLAVLLLAAAPAGAPPPVELTALIGIGIASALAMSLYLAASSLLSLPVFGLLGYVEPVLLVLVSLLLGERMQGADAVVYGILVAALTVLAVEGFRLAARRRSDPDVGGRA